MSRKRNILQLVTLATIGVGSALVLSPQEAQAVDINTAAWGPMINDNNIGTQAWQMRSGQNLYQEVFVGPQGFDLIDVAGVPTIRISGWAALRGYYHHLNWNHAYGIAVHNTLDNSNKVYQAVETQQSATHDLMVEGFWANGVEITGYPNDGSTIHNSINPNNTGIPDLITDGSHNVASNMYEAMNGFQRGNYIYDYVGYQVDIPAADVITNSATNYTYPLYLIIRFTDGYSVYNELNMNFDTYLNTSDKFYNGGQFGLDSSYPDFYKINIDYVTPRLADYSEAAPEDGWAHYGHQFSVNQTFPNTPSRKWLSHGNAGVSWSLGKVMTRIGTSDAMPVYYHVDNASWWLAQAPHGYNMQNNNGIFTNLFYASTSKNNTNLVYSTNQYTFNRGFYDYDSLVNSGANTLIPNFTLPASISAGGANPFPGPTLISGQTENPAYTAPSTFRDTFNKEWILRSKMPNGSDIVGDENQTGSADVIGMGAIDTSLKYYYERAKTPIKVRHVLVDYKLGQTTEQWTEKSVLQETTYTRYTTDFNHTFNALPDDTSHTFLHAVDVDTNTSDGIIQSNDSIANTPVPTMSFTYNPVTKDVEQTITFYYYEKDITAPDPINQDSVVSSNGTITGYLNQYLYKDASMTSATDPTASKYNVNGAVGGFENLFGVKNVSVTLEVGDDLSVYANPNTSKYSFTNDFVTLIPDGAVIDTYIAPNGTGLTHEQINSQSTIQMSDEPSGIPISDLIINKPNLSTGTATSLDLTNDKLQKIKDGTIKDDIKLTATYTVPTKIKHNYKPVQWDASGNPTVYQYESSSVSEEVQKTTVWNGSYAMDYNENQELETVNKDVYIAGDIMQSDDTSGQAIAAEFEGPANTDDAVNVSFKKYYEQLRFDDKFFNQTQLSTQTGMDVGADVTYVNTVPKDFPYANVLAKQDLGRALDNSLMFDADSQYYRVKDVDESLLATNGAVKFEGALRDTDNAELLADGVSYPNYDYGINLDFSNATKLADQAFTLTDGVARNLNVTTATLGIVSGKSPVVEKNSGLIIADETPLVAESIATSYEDYMFNNYGLTITSADADFNKPGSKYYIPLVSSVYAQPETTYTTMYTLNDVGLSDSTWTQENTFRFSDYLIGSGKDDSVFSAQRETVLDADVTFVPDVIITKTEAKTLTESDNTYVSGIKSISGYNLLAQFASIFRK